MKTTILLLHGAMGDRSQFGTLIPLFPADQPVLALSFPGHGGVPAAAPFSLSSFAAAIQQKMDEQGIGRARFFGYSMGGYVALYLASRFPDRVESIMTYGTKMEWSLEIAAGMNRMFDPEKIEAKAPQLAQAFEAVHGDWKTLCRRTSAFLTALGADEKLTDAQLGRIECPVVVGWGSEDNVVSETESRRAAGCIPQGEFLEMPGGKHQLDLLDSSILLKFVEEALRPL